LLAFKPAHVTDNGRAGKPYRSLSKSHWEATFKIPLQDGIAGLFLRKVFSRRPSLSAALRRQHVPVIVLCGYAFKKTIG
jgi:hypothetical protein